jgi:hypothetical protein
VRGAARRVERSSRPLSPISSPRDRLCWAAAPCWAAPGSQVSYSLAQTAAPTRSQPPRRHCSPPSSRKRRRRWRADGWSPRQSWRRPRQRGRRPRQRGRRPRRRVTGLLALFSEARERRRERWCRSGRLRERLVQKVGRRRGERRVGRRDGRRVGRDGRLVQEGDCDAPRGHGKRAPAPPPAHLRRPARQQLRQQACRQ